MAPPRAPYPRHVRYGVRYQARLDAETSATLEELARIFHRTRTEVLRYVMPWGLTHTGDGSLTGPALRRCTSSTSSWNRR